MVINERWGLKDKLISSVSLCLFIQLLICHQLWLDNERHYPKIPAFYHFQFEIHNTFSLLLFGLMLVCLLSFIFRKVFPLTVFLFFSLVIFFVLNDINRLQVWLYELIFILLILFVSNNRNFDIAINTIQILIIFVYLWSGIHKLNIYFVEDIFPWLMEPFGLEFFAIRNPFWAFVIAVLEIMVGFGLLLKKTGSVAAVFGIGLHLIILVILSPVGHNWNHVVWPWNILMATLIFWLFYKNEDHRLNHILVKTRQFFLLPVVLILFGIMPLFNFWRVWDEQLSFKMYSGNSPEGIFYYQDQQTDCIPSEIKQRFVHFTPGTKVNRIILDDWIFYELKVAPYKSKKRLLQAGEKLCRCIEKPELAGFQLLEVDHWDKSKDSITTFSCLELLEKVK